MKPSPSQTLIYWKTFLPRFVLMAVALLLIAGDVQKMGRLIIINRSGFPLGLLLTSQEEDPDARDIYYLSIPEGSPNAVVERQFELPQREYKMVVYYLETWDPVYGFECASPAGAVFTLRAHQQISIFPCGQKAKNRGEPTLFKLGGVRRSPRPLAPGF